MRQIITSVSCNDPELKREADILVRLEKKKSFSALVWSLMSEAIAKRKEEIKEIKDIEDRNG